MKLENYILGNWKSGDGEGKKLYNAVNGDLIATASSDGINFADVFDYGRTKGSASLRKMTFQQRGNMLKKLALHLTKQKEIFYEISYKTGATRTDSWIDIEGGFGNLFANASLRRNFANETFHVDGEGIDLSRGESFMGHHIMVPKKGVAIHINAFNFPIWGMLEKCAVNWMAGVAAVVKPATVTSFLTEAVCKAIIESKILPEGSLQLVCGSARNILDEVQSQDIVTFTGSAWTGQMLKAHKAVIENSVPFNMEADSLNCIVLGEDAKPGTPEFKLFVKEIRKEMTTKCGQKCTAIRRVIVPQDYLEDVQIALGKELAKVTIGNPTTKGVRMGSLVGKSQVEEVKENIRKIAETAQIVFGEIDKVAVLDADAEKGAFMSPILMMETSPMENTAVHEIEAFGPVSTLMPYKNLEEAIKLAQMGKGSLVSSIATFDDEIAREYVVEAASHHGRIMVINREMAKFSTGHGSPLPYLTHGGPGRAGGGEEMGGMRGIKHYLQRCAIQGTPTTITKITGIYQPNAKYIEAEKHPFTYHFDDIKTGMSLKTHKRTLTDSDIQNFANLTWDHFYAHTDITSLGGTIFEKRAAHGYFIISAAAGLFVYPNKGPVAANYGLEEIRFLKPMYHNDTIYVRLTCKQKIERDWKGREFPSGVVKWFVEVFDQEDEVCAIGTILTLVQKKSPFMEFTKQNIEASFAKLKDDTKALWGKMSAQKMVEHLAFQFDVAIGKVKHEILTPENNVEKWGDSLYNNYEMPKDFEHPLFKKENATKVEFENLAEAKKVFWEKYEAYENHFKENPDFVSNNSTFGPLNKEMWDLLSRKHFTHHFKQFGLWG